MQSKVTEMSFEIESESLVVIISKAKKTHFGLDMLRNKASFDHHRNKLLGFSEAKKLFQLLQFFPKLLASARQGMALHLL